MSETLLKQMSEVGRLVQEYPNLSEVMVNSDGSVWLENQGSVHQHHQNMSDVRIDSIVKLLAGHYKLVVDKENPSLSVKLPIFHGGRFQALVPPIVSSPTFSIRFPPTTTYSLDDLLDMKTINANQYNVLHDAVITKKNIIVAGATGSGKTTLSNALLHLITDERLIIIEDSPEIVTRTKNKVHMLTDSNFSLRDAVKASLRLRPDRIIIGEIRDGGTAIELCKAWLTGHPGGIGTIHSSGASEVKNRVCDLMNEVVVKPSKALVDSSIDVIVFMEKVYVGENKMERKVTEIIAK